MNILRKSLDTDPSSPMAVWGHLILRASIGVMIFYIHGWHKLEGGLAYVQHGTPWTLAKEVTQADEGSTRRRTHDAIRRCHGISRLFS